MPKFKNVVAALAIGTALSGGVVSLGAATTATAASAASYQMGYGCGHHCGGYCWDSRPCGWRSCHRRWGCGWGRCHRRCGYSRCYRSRCHSSCHRGCGRGWGCGGGRRVNVNVSNSPNADIDAG